MQLITHADPVWRQRVDDTLSLDVPDLDDLSEQLAVRQVSDAEYEICCLPFTIYDLCLGDVVEVSQDGGRRRIVRTVHDAGRHLFRVSVADNLTGVTLEEVAASLRARGHLVEVWGQDLIAVDAEDDAAAQALGDHLGEREDAGDLVFETGRQG